MTNHGVKKICKVQHIYNQNGLQFTVCFLTNHGVTRRYPAQRCWWPFLEKKKNLGPQPQWRCSQETHWCLLFTTNPPAPWDFDRTKRFLSDEKWNSKIYLILPHCVVLRAQGQVPPGHMNIWTKCHHLNLQFIFPPSGQSSWRPPPIRTLKRAKRSENMRKPCVRSSNKVFVI